MLLVYLLLLVLFLTGAHLYPRYVIRSGKKALYEGRFDSAIAWLQKGHDEDAKVLLQEAYLSRGQSFLNAGNYSAAADDFERAGYEAVDEETLSRLWIGIAQEKMSEGHYAEAKRYLERTQSAHQFQSLLIECNYHLAEAAYSSGDSAKAILLLSENGQDEVSKQLSLQIRVEKAKSLYAAEEYDACESLVLLLMDEGADVQDIYLELVRRKDTERFENATE